MNLRERVIKMARLFFIVCQKAPEAGQPINIPKFGTVGYVSEVIDNKKKGEQAYINTPEKLPI